MATFFGSEFISYNFSGKGGEAITHSSEEIELSFKTSASDGFIFYSGKCVVIRCTHKRT